MSDLERAPTIDALIRRGAALLRESPTATLDARVIAKAAFGLDDAAMIARGADAPGDAAAARFAAMIFRRAKGEPVAHITGRREFWSLEIEVEPGILVPRADSETLIDAIARRRPAHEPLQILDLGCGSGALLCALLSVFPRATGIGVDRNLGAVALTSRNLQRLGFGERGDARQGDWFDGTAAPFDVIIANPPYIPEGDRDILPREVRDFEDPGALFAGADGLDAIRSILAEAPSHLAPDGLIALEFGVGQADALNELARTAFPAGGFSVENDLAGRPRAFLIDLRRRRT
jgi:release factor glutamine methyltransferase